METCIEKHKQESVPKIKKLFFPYTLFKCIVFHSSICVRLHTANSHINMGMKKAHKPWLTGNINVFYKRSIAKWTAKVHEIVSRTYPPYFKPQASYSMLQAPSVRHWMFNAEMTHLKRTQAYKMEIRKRITNNNQQWSDMTEQGTEWNECKIYLPKGKAKNIWWVHTKEWFKLKNMEQTIFRWNWEKRREIHWLRNGWLMGDRRLYAPKIAKVHRTPIRSNEFFKCFFFCT